VVGNLWFRIKKENAGGNQIDCQNLANTQKLLSGASSVELMADPWMDGRARSLLVALGTRWLVSSGI
jgi:hypothetical protein